jgi:hypothetical protein
MDRAASTRTFAIMGVVLGLAVLDAGRAHAVSCTGIPAFAYCTAYANGASVTYNGAKYTAIAPIPNNRDCPPNSPYTPATDNWWTNNGACTTGATATATATRAATATATSGSATPTRTSAPPTPTTPPSNTVLFHNTGTTSGWSSFSLEHWGSITQVTSPVYKGSSAIKVTQIYDPNYTGRYHSEVVRNDGYKPGQMRFYGFAFQLPANWQFVNQSFNIAQFIADFTNTGCDDWMPTTMMWISGNTLHTRVKSGTVCGQQTTTFNSIANVTAGQWHKVVIQANWKADSTGYFKVWYDGVKVLERLNIPTTISDPQNRTYSFRVGMYANAWHDDHTMLGTQGTRSLFIDQVGIGGAFADANPDAW